MKPNGLKPTSKPPPAFQTASVPVLTDFVFQNVKTASGHTTTDACLFYSELNLNQYSVGSPCRTICTVCGSPPCPDLNLIHYRTDCITEYPASRVFPPCPSDRTAKSLRRDRGRLKRHLRAVIQFFFGLQFKKYKPKGRNGNRPSENTKPVFRRPALTAYG